MVDLFEIVVHNLDDVPSLTGICAGYECGEWRSALLAKTMMRSLPDFCLRYSEYKGLNYENAMKYIATAAQTVYKSEKYSKRGEFGELLLHVILKEIFQTIPAVSKIYFKDGPNETVKGFDAVHVVFADAYLELWLGEVKFYESITHAIRDVTKELEQHFQRDYLKSEFMAVSNKIDDQWPHAEKLKLLLDPDTTLDRVFEHICIPVLLTYESKTTQQFNKLCDEYREQLSAELSHYYAVFRDKNPLKEMRVRLILLPLKNKKALVEEMHKMLEAAKCL